nr:hypothetical protein [Tanacetum cinerariifolium]
MKTYEMIKLLQQTNKSHGDSSGDGGTNPAGICKPTKAMEIQVEMAALTLLEFDDYDIQITSWIEQLALEFRYLKELHIRGLAVCNEYLKTLARTRGKDLRTLKLDGIWLHQLALNSTVLERLHVMCTDISNAEDLTLLAKNCCNSLVSLKIRASYLSKLRNAFGYAVSLEYFAGNNWDEEIELVRLGDISNEAIEFVGTHVKNLCKFHMNLVEKDGTTDLPLDNGILTMLMGCNKLEWLDIRLFTHGGLTDVGLEYIRRYGANLRSLSLTRIGNSNAGLVKLSQGRPKLRKLKLRGCPFSKQVVTSFVFNMPSLRTMSSPNHPTSDIEDAFFSNSPDYIPASSDYSPASPGNIPS